MNHFPVFFLALVACANAGVIVAPAGEIIQGPGTKTTILGPDGSSITQDTPGGSVVTKEGGVIATTTGVATPVVAPVVAEAPTLVATAPVITAPALLARSPVLAPAPWTAPVLGGTVIAGPSGTITSSEPWAVPLITTVW